MSTPAELTAEAALRTSKKPQQWVTTLRECRQRLGLKLRHVAPPVGVSLMHLSALELGHCAPSLDLAFRLAAFYGQDIATLWVRRLDGSHLLPEA